MRILLLLGVILLLGATQSYALHFPPDSVKNDTVKRSSFLVIPIVYFTPETQWAGGAGGVYTFRFPKESDTTQASQLTFGGAYTQLRQVLSYVSGRVYWGEEKNVAYGEVGYYIYNYFFYGVGNKASVDQEELYGVRFPRARLNYLRQLSPHWYGGLRYWYDGYEITDTEEGGALAADSIPGSRGGTVSAIGLVANYDTRDNIFWPSEGTFLEISGLVHAPWTGSDYRYRRLSIDASQFYTLPWWDHLLALNYWTDLTFGDPPFNDMPLMGGPKKMRGFYQGRYLDKQLMMLQAEYRMPVFWRFRAVAFGSIGGVAPRLSAFTQVPLRYTYGAGLRFLMDKTNQVNIRFDVGFDQEGTPAYYLTVGEAF
ncbi:MAG: BamA/TamA family outer membrane protein [Bacteroidota bacterium]